MPIKVLVLGRGWFFFGGGGGVAILFMGAGIFLIRGDTKMLQKPKSSQGIVFVQFFR